MLERKSLTWPISLAIVMIVLIVGLTVGWVLVNVFGAITNQSGSALYWTLLTVGSIMFALVLTGVILYLVWSIQQVDLNRRQSNFLDAVTHELKSPIASLKLFLQTLNRHDVRPEQRREFYRSMMDDVERLDRLITQLLDVAKLEHDSNEPQQSDWVSLPAIVQSTASKLQEQYRLSPDALTLEVDECEIWGKQVDVEILIRNLLDNAIKYAGNPPSVSLQATVSNDESELRIVFQDNGNGIPRHLRRAIFRRFYRVGNELERTKPGTGLGLFIVRDIIKRLGGTIRVEEPAKASGARFVVLLPQVRRSSTQSDSPSLPISPTS